ncbi:hypothetical protein ScPMuIL_018459 [Solemya velum]
MAHVAWSEGSGEHRRHRSAKEEYFRLTTLLCGKLPGESGEDMIIGPGQHVHPFTFVLPNEQLPMSFETETGRVRYTIKATVDRPWAIDYVTTQPFTVLSALDLNSIPEAKVSDQNQVSKTICCLCCASGPITSHFRIDKRGYVPGETIVVNGDVVNNSSRNILSVAAILEMVTTYKADGARKTHRKEVASIRDDGIGPMGAVTWSGKQLKVPAVPASFLVGCNIIDITYILKITADAEHTPFDVDVPLTIIVGTIPLASGQFTEPVSAMEFQTPPQPIVVAQPMPGGQLPPPSYAEYAFGKVDIQDDKNQYGELSYAPVYQYYDYS